MPFAKSSSRELQIVDPVLSQLARSYRPDGFVGQTVCPTIPVEKDSGLYPVFDDAYWFGDDVDNRVSDRAETPEIDFSWSTESYLCEDYRLKASITKKERRQAHGALRLEENKTELVLTRMAMRRERRIAAMLRDTTNGGQLTGGTSTPSALWDTDAATIEADLLTAKLAVRNKTGILPNTLLIDYEVACRIALQADIREILKYTVDGRLIIGEGEAVLPAKLWGLKVLVANPLVNTAKEGATKSLSSVWGKHARVLYVNPNGGWGKPSVAYQFKAVPEEVDKWSEKDPPVDYVRAWETVDEKVCAPDTGYEFESVIS
jgi:hypothetical protein